MVEFGAPLADDEQELHALRAALDMQSALEELNRKWQAEGKPAARMGVGINTGPAVVGNIGSAKQMQYTAVGDTVNVASRLQAATKILQHPILFGEATYQAVKDVFRCLALGEIALPGRQEPIRVYTLETPAT